VSYISVVSSDLLTTRNRILASVLRILPQPSTISRKERTANNLVGNHHFKNPFAFHTSNCLAAHLSKSRSGANVNNLFLSALRASNRHNEVGQFSGAGHLHLGA